MKAPSEADLTQARHKAEMSNALPVLKFEVDNLQKNADNRAYQAIREEKLTPELAVQLWLEKYSYWSLMHRFDSKVR